jgi:hypothetical protein
MLLAKPASSTLARGVELDDAQKFLSRVVPWDGESFVNLHWRFKGEGYDRPGWGGRATRSIDEALGSLRYQVRKLSTLDIYICMSSQRLARVEKHNGREWNAAMRIGSNAVALKALYADLDVKDGAYENTREALAALYSFCDGIRLPRPTVLVQSGSGGLHAYWVLDQALSVNEWKPLAHALSHALQAHKVHCDTGCTVDSVRILRVPQTLNYKHDPPREVKLGPMVEHDYPVEQLWSALEPFRTMVATSPALPPKPHQEGADEVDDELGAGVEKLPERKINLKDRELLQGCGFLRNALVTGGRDYNNPLWMLTTLVATFTENGEHNAHAMASGHPTYEKEQTDAMYARKLKDREEKGLGWPACSTIRAAGCASCPTCPNLRLARTPLHLAAKAKVQPSVSAAAQSAPGAPAITLPGGYVQDAAGHILLRKRDSDGNVNLVPITMFTMNNVWVQADPWILHFERSTADGIHKEKIIFADVPGDQLFMRVLVSRGIPIQEAQLKPFRSFLMAWLSHLQASRNNVVKSLPYGWYPEKGAPTGFTFGGHTYSKEGSRVAAQGDPNIASQFEPIGAKEPWMEAAKFITKQGRQDLCAILATTFAGPLMRFAGAPGVIVSGYSPDSGIGKTTAMRVAQSVWGHPKLAMQGLKATNKSVLYKMGELRNVPMYWDELQNVDHTKSFVDIIFAVSEGQEMSRLTRQVTMRKAGDWDTMMIVASNTSISDAIAKSTASTTAGINRVFEFRVRPAPKTMYTGEANITLSRIYENYGNIGVDYARWLGEHPEQVRENVQSSLIQLQKEVDEANEERLWTAAMTTILLGAKYANDLGFTEFDLTALKAFLYSALQNQRNEKGEASVDLSQESNISNVLQQFLKATSVKNTVHTNRVHSGGGKPTKGSISVIGDTSKLDGIQVQVGRDDKIMRISATFMHKWLKDHHYNPFAIKKALEDKFHVKQLIGRVGAGSGLTQVSQFAERVYEIDLNIPELQGVVDI